MSIIEEEKESEYVYLDANVWKIIIHIRNLRVLLLAEH
jgi:hypothetical protein